MEERAEDREFSPMHRIVRVQKKGKDREVWDRKLKVDLVFGCAV